MKIAKYALVLSILGLMVVTGVVLSLRVDSHLSADEIAALSSEAIEAGKREVPSILESWLAGRNLSASDYYEDLVEPTPYEGLVERLAPTSERAASYVIHFHGKIVSSKDDPAWTRKMERQLLEYVLSDPASETTEVSAITCRSAGCEIQLLHEAASSFPEYMLARIPHAFPSLRAAFGNDGYVNGKHAQVLYFLFER
jgi:hypothetical protein